MASAVAYANNLSQFMRHARSVTSRDGRRWHWVVEAPAGKTVEWDADIIEDEPGLTSDWVRRQRTMLSLEYSFQPV
jgi:uncharacterized membrane protein